MIGKGERCLLDFAESEGMDLPALDEEVKKQAD